MHCAAGVCVGPQDRLCEDNHTVPWEGGGISQSSMDDDLKNVPDYRGYSPFASHP